MGRHSAGNGARVDPIVEAALRQRTTSVEPGPPRHAPGLADGQQVDSRQGESQPDGGLGWPGEPGEGSGLGWPDRDGATHPAAAETAEADTAESATTESDTTGSATTVAVTPVTPVTPVAPAAGVGRPDRRRSGWRRWLGGSPAASSARSGSDAA